jgi:hypothetical protein
MDNGEILHWKLAAQPQPPVAVSRTFCCHGALPSRSHEVSKPLRQQRSSSYAEDFPLKSGAGRWYPGACKSPRWDKYTRSTPCYHHTLEHKYNSATPSFGGLIPSSRNIHPIWTHTIKKGLRNTSVRGEPIIRPYLRISQKPGPARNQRLCG